MLTSAGAVAVPALGAEAALFEIRLAIVGRLLQKYKFTALGCALLTDAATRPQAVELGPLEHEVRPPWLLLQL